MRSSPSEAVRKILSPMMTGDDLPSGRSVFQRTFLAGPNSVGSGPQAGQRPEPLGPRNWGQSAAGRDSARRRKERVRMICFHGMRID